MTTKNLITLGVAAVVLGTAAYLSGSGRKMKAPSLIGKPVMANFDISKIAKIEIGGAKAMTLASTDDGWVLESLYGYPADLTKIRENLLKLKELKVGHVAAGKKLEGGKMIDLQDASGKSIAALAMGEMHQRQATGQMAQFGGGSYPDGRYVQVGDQVALVKETLEAFDGDPKSWADTQIAAVPSADVTAVQMIRDDKMVKLTKKDGAWTMDGLTEKEEFDTSKSYGIDSALSYLNFTGVIDPAKSEEELGISTGAVYTVMLKNGQTYTAKIGNKVENGTDRYFKVKAAFSPTGTNETENAATAKVVEAFNAKTAKWTYTIACYSADNRTKTRDDLVKAKEEPKKEEPKAEEPKAEAPKAAEPKVEAPKAEEPVKAEAPKAAEPVNAEAPKAAEPVKAQAPKAAEPAKVEAPKADAPKAEAPKAEAPKAEPAKDEAKK